VRRERHAQPDEAPAQGVATARLRASTWTLSPWPHPVTTPRRSRRRRLEQRGLIRSVLTDQVERAFADAHLDGRPIPDQAKIIGAAHLTEADQRRLVAVWWHRVREKAKWWIRRSRVRESR
jgi:hypothetical protein